MSFTRILSVFISIFGAMGSAQAAGPSFDCKAASTPVETAICGDEALSKLDLDMRSALSAAYKNVDLKEALLAGQRIWLAARQDCLTPRVDDPRLDAVACLRGRYERRLSFLYRPMNLRSENICHSFGDAITFANGYRGVYNQHSIWEDAAIDVSGAITYKTGTAKIPNMISNKIQQIDPPDATRYGLFHSGPFFYLLGPSSETIAVSESFGGELAEQVVNDHRLKPVASCYGLKPDRSAPLGR